MHPCYLSELITQVLTYVVLFPALILGYWIQSGNFGPGKYSRVHMHMSLLCITVIWMNDSLELLYEAILSNFDLIQTYITA